MRSVPTPLALTLPGALAFVLSATALAQTQQPPQGEMKVPKPVPVPPLPAAPRASHVPVPEPTDPPARTVVDARAHLSFHLPAGWALARRDGELSTFHLDARTAPPVAQLREVANLSFNPFPASTFAGALFYVSVEPRSTAESCAAQVAAKPARSLPPMTIAGEPFSRGLDEHGHICTEARVLTYTTLRGNACVRFDMAVNTFCGGEDSGAQEITQVQLASVFHRMQGILESVKFTQR